jgi:hypothetical protein
MREMPNLDEGTRARRAGLRLVRADCFAGARLGRVMGEGTWQWDQRVDR